MMVEVLNNSSSYQNNNSASLRYLIPYSSGLTFTATKIELKELK